MANLFIHEKLFEGHCQDVQRRARQQAVLADAQGAHVDRHYQLAMARHVIALLGKGLVALGTRLEGVEQSERQVAYNR